MDAISSIAGLLMLCGISSVRMFAPAFLFGVICRCLPGCSWCPSGIVDLAASCPSFLTSNFGLFVFGVLGTLEVVANWDDSIRELISETNIEKYAKPVFATLISYSICTPEQAQALSAVVNGVPDAMAVAGDPAAVGVAAEAVTSTVSAVVSGLDACSVTNAVSAATNIVAAATQEVVAVTNTVAAATQEVAETSGSSWSAIVSSLFCGGGTFCLCKVRSAVVASVRELDPDNSLHLNTLLTLVEEGSWLAILPLVMVFPLLALFLMAVFAFFGWVLSRPIKMIAERRKAYWDSVGKEGALRAVRIRALVIFSMGVFLSAIPVFGYLVTVVALNLFVFSVISLYEKSAYRILVKIVMRFIKLTIFLVSILFSGIPFFGIVLLLPYLVSFLLRTRRMSAQ